ncbi:MAG: trypsin-like peptidase domain-containing protein [Myxococcales bacterium]
MPPLKSLLIAALVVLVPLHASAKGLWQDAPARKGQKLQTLPDFTRLAHDAMGAVVSISTLQPTEGDESLKDLLGEARDESQKGIGSGFFVRPDGYIVTNAHVVENATEILVSVQRNGRLEEYPARVIGSDAPTDVALLKVESDRPFPTLPLGDSDKLMVAEWVAAIGNPFGLSHSVTVGVVSFKGRTDVTPAGREGYYDYIQTDASINPGNSGGPLLDSHGAVIGIANAVNASGQGIGFAIPINMAKQVLEPLMRNGQVQRSWLGITVQDITPEVARVLGLPGAVTGVVVSDVVEGSPGHKAGLQVGDLITEFNGQQVNDAHRLRWLASIGGVGTDIPLVARRGGKTAKFHATLAALPNAAPAEDIPQPIEWGLVVRSVDVPTARTQGLALPFGARVQEVKPGSSAAKAGLKPGDVILKVDDYAIRVPRMLSRALQRVDEGSISRFVVRRAGETVFLNLPRP